MDFAWLREIIDAHNAKERAEDDRRIRLQARMRARLANLDEDLFEILAVVFRKDMDPEPALLTAQQAMEE